MYNRTDMENIEKLISSPNKIPKATPKDTVGSVLENVKSSHDPVFVYDGKNFLGIVSGSQSFFKKRYPTNTKVLSALIKPPKITKNSSIFEVARQMISSKIYTLPVFDKDGNVTGVISARTILDNVASDSKIHKLIKDFIEIEKPITATIHDRVRDVYSLLRKEKTSRIVIVEEGKEKIKGLVTRRDLQQVFIATPKKGRSNKTKNNRSYVIDDKDLKKFDFPIAEFVNIRVVTLPAKANIRSILNVLKTKKVNSVILVDQNFRAKGIVSLRSFLEALSKVEPQKKLPIMLSDKHKIADVRVHKTITSLLQKLEKKVDKISPIKDVKVTLDADKNPKGYVKQYDIHLHVNFKSGKIADTKVKGKELLASIREATNKVSSQIKLNHKKKRR